MTATGEPTIELLRQWANSKPLAIAQYTSLCAELHALVRHADHLLSANQATEAMRDQAAIICGYWSLAKNCGMPVDPSFARIALKRLQRLCQDAAAA